MIGLALGALKFGVSAFGALSGHADAAAAARRQNNQALKIYKYQIKQHRINYAQRVADFGNRKIQYQEQMGYNFTAAQRAYQAQQARLNEMYKQMQFAEQGSQVQLQNAVGKSQAREVSGKSADRMLTMMRGDFGRNQAIREEQFSTAIENAELRNRRTTEQLKIANRKAFWQVGQPPAQTELPPPPLMQQGPSSAGLIAGLGQAALGAFNTFQSYQNYDPSGGGSGGNFGNYSNLNPSANYGGW